MIPIVKAITLSVPFAVISGSSLYAYDAYWPKTIGDWFKVEGIPVIIKESKDKENNHLKAMFNDHKEEVKDLGVDGLTSTTSEDAAVPKLKEWCQTNLKKPWTKELKERMYRYCIYKPRTVKGLIIGSGKYENFITEDEDYETVFAVYKENSINKSSEENYQESDIIEIRQGELKNWCETQLNEEIEKSIFVSGNYSIIFSICTKLGYRTVQEKLNKTNSDWKMIGKGEEEKWQDAFEKWKHTPNVLEAIKKVDGGESISSSTPKEEGGPKMKDWCAKGMEKKLFEESVYPEEYVLLMSACREAK